MKTIKFADKDPRAGQVVQLDDAIAQRHIDAGAATEVSGAKASTQAIQQQEEEAAKMTRADPEAMMAQRERNAEVERRAEEDAEAAAARRERESRQAREAVEARKSGQGGQRESEAGKGQGAAGKTAGGTSGTTGAAKSGGAK